MIKTDVFFDFTDFQVRGHVAFPDALHVDWCVVFFGLFGLFSLFIDLLTDTVQPLSRCVHCLGGNNVLGSVSGQERVADGGKVDVFVVHVGGTRCVTWSIDRIVQRHAWITWGVELIPRHVCHLFLVCLTDMTTTIARLFQCLTLPGA